MVSRRARDPDQAPVTRSLVPASLGSPLGILDASSLKLLLGSSDPAAHSQTTTTNDPNRPASSELARAYGVSSGDEGPLYCRSTRRVLVQTKRQRRSVPVKLEPVEGSRSTPSPLRRPDNAGQPLDIALQGESTQQQEQEQPTLSIFPTKTDTDDQTRHRGINRSRHPRDTTIRPICLSNASPTIIKRIEKPTLKQRACLLPQRTPVGVMHSQPELQRELQWIHTHFPVLHLANAKCSLPLRTHLFVDTITRNIRCGSLRLSFSQWKADVHKQRQIEMSRLTAFDRMVVVFEQAARSHLAHRFGVWTQYVHGCRDVERLAAAIAIQKWLAWCRQCHEGRASLSALSLARTLSIADAHATQIQQRYRVHVAQQALRHALRAVTKIQRCVRTTKQRRIVIDQQMAAKKLNEVLALTLHNEQLQVLTVKCRDRQARTIGMRWRQYATGRTQLVHEYVEALVDQVEFCAAVLSIQRHIRGYQCRFRKHCIVQSSVRIQHAWRQHLARSMARQQRKTLMLMQSVAASCLQRTFRRNCERKKHCAVLQKSSRPMYMRAVGASPSFCLRFHVAIVKSAISVIQSTWRRHVKNKRWRHTREVATRRIQRWLCRWRVLSLWRATVRSVGLLDREQQRDHAARRLQRWCRCRLDAKHATATRQLVAMLTSVMTIQRYYHHKNDPWHQLIQHILHVQLPHVRIAARTIQKCWRSHIDKKQQLLALQDEAAYGAPLPRALGVHGLQDYLVRQQYELKQHVNAAKTIQKAFRQLLARRDGKLLLKRYRLLYHRDLRRRQQRHIIHGFLVERQDERERKQQARATVPASSLLSMASPTSTATPTNEANNSDDLVPATNRTDTRTVASDDPDVVKCWSDEHQSHYWFYTRTGESEWCE